MCMCVYVYVICNGKSVECSCKEQIFKKVGNRKVLTVIILQI